MRLLIILSLPALGARECIERGCEYSCQVIENKLWCVCPPGMRTTFGLYCYGKQMIRLMFHPVL